MYVTLIVMISLLSIPHLWHVIVQLFQFFLFFITGLINGSTLHLDVDIVSFGKPSV